MERMKVSGELTKQVGALPNGQTSFFCPEAAFVGYICRTAKLHEAILQTFASHTRRSRER